MTEEQPAPAGQQFTLADLCAPIAAQPRREYPHYHPVPPFDPLKVLTVRLSLLAAALNGDPIWCSTKENRTPGQTVVVEKYQRAIASLQNGQAIYMPWLTFGEGRTRIMDGRHRLYALLDSGYTHAAVRVRPEYVPMIATLCEKGEEKPA